MTHHPTLVFLAGILLLSGGCAPAEHPWPVARPAATQARVGGASADVEASNEARLTSLDVPGFLPAVFFSPAGDAERPLVVAAHGAGGSPDWECEYWRRLTHDKAFLVCLRGTAMGGDSFYFKNHYALRDELAAAISAARAHAPRIAPGGGIYAGFSQGASMGSLVVTTQAQQLPYVILIEGFEQWNVALGRSFERKGGKGVLFACGTAQCATKAEKSQLALRNTTLRARARHAPGAGHTPLGPVQQAVTENLAWLVEGDALWK
jgi:predicted esterase